MYAKMKGFYFENPAFSFFVADLHNTERKI